MWLIADTPVTVRMAQSEVTLTPGIPHELPEAVGQRVLQCAGDRVHIHNPGQETVIEPAAPTARPVYWERADTSIVGPGRPEFLARVGSGPQASFWVVALYEGQPVWINSIQLRSKRQFEAQVRPVVVRLAKGVDGRRLTDHTPRQRAASR